jgi:hypothetical protein
VIELLLQADRLLTVDLVDAADAIYRKVADTDPRNAIAVVGMARCALARGDDHEAYRLAARARAIDPQNDMARRMEARLDEVLRTRGEVPGQGVVAAPAAVANPGAVATAEAQSGVGSQPNVGAQPDVRAQPDAVTPVAPTPVAVPPPSAVGSAGPGGSTGPGPASPPAVASRRSLLDRLRAR